jgi:hypothetical protein
MVSVQGKRTEESGIDTVKRVRVGALPIAVRQRELRLGLRRGGGPLDKTVMIKRRAVFVRALLSSLGDAPTFTELPVCADPAPIRLAANGTR